MNARKVAICAPFAMLFYSLIPFTASPVDTIAYTKYAHYDRHNDETRNFWYVSPRLLYSSYLLSNIEDSENLFRNYFPHTNW